MKKRVLASFLTAVMVMGMVGCGSADTSCDKSAIELVRLC